MEFLGEGTFSICYRDGRYVRKELKSDNFSELLKMASWLINPLIKEAEIQRRAADLGLAPDVIEATEEYILMEFVEGETLGSFVDHCSDGDLRTFALNVADGIRRMRGIGLYHNDLHDENIIVRPDLSVMFIDFGLAKQARTKKEHYENYAQTLGTICRGAERGCRGYIEIAFALDWGMGFVVDLPRIAKSVWAFAKQMFSKGE